jgi:hypothetical protein
MMTESTRPGPSDGVRSTRVAFQASALALTLAIGVAGCSSVFDVENPNDLPQDALAVPTGATAAVNGAEATVSRGYADLVLAISIPTDELTWIGTYDAGNELDHGFLSNPANEFTDNEGAPTFNEGRFMADEAITLLEGHDAAGDLNDRNLLVRSYLYGGIIYTAIPDWFDDFVISDRRTPSPPIGPANMGQLYDTAIDYFTKGITLAQATGNGAMEATLLAGRARAEHARGVWALLEPAGTVPTNPLVNDAAAVADARAALALVDPDWAYQFTYSASTIGSQLGSWINSRQEFRVDTAYGVPNTPQTRVTDVQLQDPIDHAPDATLRARLTEGGMLATSTELYPPLTVYSARELHLILAEAALAAGDMPGFTTEINAVRGLSGKTPYSGQIPALDLLVHERRVNLFLQGRRLADMYRFGKQDPRWLATSDAVLRPGTFFPITDKEIRANCFLNGGC